MADNSIFNKKQYLCKYSVDQLILFLKDEYIEMDPSNILSIEYLNDYEINIRAVLKITIRIDLRKKLWILKHKNSIRAKFELSTIGMDIDLDNQIIPKKVIWNKNFGVYFNDEDDSSDITVLEERLKKNDTKGIDEIHEENYYESQNMLDIYLFDQLLLNASNRTFNDVFTEDTLQPMIGKVLNVTKHPKKILMGHIENNRKYEELLVPALPAYKALIYLDQYYGLYKTGAIIYYDVDTLYILAANGKCTVKRKNEYPESCFLVRGIDSSVPGNGMIKSEGEKVHYISLSDGDIKPKKFSITKNAKQGSLAKMVVTDDITIDVTEADQSYMDQRNEAFLYTRKNDNRYAANIAKARMEENEINMYIQSQNLDIRAFTPNKRFKIVFQDPAKQKKYGKYRYRIAYAYHYITLEGESYMSSHHKIILRRASNGKLS